MTPTVLILLIISLVLLVIYQSFEGYFGRHEDTEEAELPETYVDPSYRSTKEIEFSASLDWRAKQAQRSREEHLGKQD